MRDTKPPATFWINRFYRALTIASNFIGCFCLGCMTIITLIAIFWRYALNSALPWPEEATRYFFIVATYMGISVVAAKDAHLKMDVLSLYVGKAFQRVLQLISALITSCFFCFLCYLSWTMMLKIKMMKQLAISFPLPLWIVWAIMCLTFIITALQVFRTFCRALLGCPENEPTGEEIE